MNRYLLPFKREFWEHKGSFAWLPATVALLICLLMAGALTAVSTGMVDIRGDIEFSFNDGPEHHSQEHNIRRREALLQAREGLLQSRESLARNGADVDAAEIERHLADAQAELAEAERELAEDGIHIDLTGMMASVDQHQIRAQVTREIDREIAKLDAQIAEMSALPPVPPIPPVPPLPGTEAKAPEAGGPVRTFPSEVIVIEKDEDTRQSFSDENVEDMNKVLKVFFALFSGLMIVVSVFYLLGSLYSDRKDQSILFWKSMPVSESQQVLTKLATGLVLLPTIAVLGATVVAVIFQWLAMIFVSLHSPTTTAMELWSGTHPLSIGVNHWFVAMGVSLWSLPFFAWLMLASASARRSPLLLAVVPPALLVLFEEIVFDTNNLLELLASRIPSLVIEEGAGTGFTMFERAGLTDLGNFVTSPGLWLGAAIAGLLLAACVWLRNHRYEI